jgi:hypothetical protein
MKRPIAMISLALGPIWSAAVTIVYLPPQSHSDEAHVHHPPQWGRRALSSVRLHNTFCTFFLLEFAQNAS